MMYLKYLPCRHVYLFLTFGISLSILQVAWSSDSFIELLNTCLDSQNHKKSPGPEAELFDQCTPWKNRSCCTTNTSQALHTMKLYNFEINHCKKQQKELSPECARHFVQDMCFYECSPNIGPWKVKINRKFAKERFYRVPLCFSDCESWFNACRRDYTCVPNWPRNMNFTGGQGNRCPANAECRTFEEVYNNDASLFCNQVWDESWMVVPDNQLCFRIWFDGTKGNPNERAAAEYVKKLESQVNDAISVAHSGLTFLNLLLWSLHLI